MDGTLELPLFCVPETSLFSTSPFSLFNAGQYTFGQEFHLYCSTCLQNTSTRLCCLLMFLLVFFLHRADAYTWKLGWQSAWQSAKTQTHTHRHTCCFWHQADRLPPLLMLFVLSVPPQSRHLRRALVNVETQHFLFEELTRPRCAAGPGDAAYLQ